MSLVCSSPASRSFDSATPIDAPCAGSTVRTYVRIGEPPVDVRRQGDARGEHPHLRPAGRRATGRKAMASTLRGGTAIATTADRASTGAHVDGRTSAFGHAPHPRRRRGRRRLGVKAPWQEVRPGRRPGGRCEVPSAVGSGVERPPGTWVGRVGLSRHPPSVSSVLCCPQRSAGSGLRVEQREDRVLVHPRRERAGLCDDSRWFRPGEPVTQSRTRDGSRVVPGRQRIAFVRSIRAGGGPTLFVMGGDGTGGGRLTRFVVRPNAIPRGRPTGPRSSTRRARRWAGRSGSS